MAGYRLGVLPTSSQPSIRAAGKDLEKLATVLERAGVNIHDQNGRLRSAEALTAEIGALPIDPIRRIELKASVERADLGMPF